MRPVQTDLRTERVEYRDHGRQVVRQPLGELRRLAEAGQVDGYDIPLRGERRQHGGPRLVMVTYAMEQQQRIAGTGPLVRHGHGPGPMGRFDAERDRAGHAGLPG